MGNVDQFPWIIASRYNEYCGYQLNWYVSGIAFGTMAGFLTFIYAGYYLLTAFQNSQLEICLVAGFVLLIASFFHIKRMVLSPASARYSDMINKMYR